MRKPTDGYVVIYSPDRAFPWQAFIPEQWAEYLDKCERRDAGEPYVYAVQPMPFTMTYTRIGLCFAVRSEEKRRARKARRTARRLARAQRRGWSLS